MEELRLHNTTTTIYFPMIKAGVQDFAQGGDWTPAAADTKLSLDGGAFANSTNLPAHEGQGIWSLVLTAGELNGKTMVMSIIDAATKAVEDQSIVVSTYGNAAAQIVALPADVIQWLGTAPGALIGGAGGRVDASVGAMEAAVLTAAAIANNAITAVKIATDALTSAKIDASFGNELADALLSRDFDQVEAAAPVHSLVVAGLHSVSRVRDNSGVEQTFQTDGSTLKASRTLTPDATAQPIKEAGVAT